MVLGKEKQSTLTDTYESKMYITFSRFSIFMLVYALCLTVAANENLGPTAVMGIDFRAEAMKLSLIRHNGFSEIVYYKGIKKEIPVAVAFRDNERIFGDDALAFGLQNPKFCYMYLLDLIGKTMDNPMIRLFQKRFPQYDIVEDTLRHSVLFKHDMVTFYSPEELLAMILMDAKDYVKRTTNLDMKEIVITVPAYFNQAERKALISVCSLAKLKVNQLITQHSAVALDYARHRVEEFHENAKYFMFFDMDAYSTVATIVRFQLEKRENETKFVPRITVIAVGFDRSLGGLEMQFRLRDHLARKFNEKNVTNTNAFDDYVVLSKLFAEASVLKNTLSFNEESQCDIHNLIEVDKINFKQNVTRAEFENLCEDMESVIVLPVHRALEVSQLSLSSVERIILINYSSQIPFIKRVLRENLSLEDNKFVDVETTVAAAGAAFEAAINNPNFIQDNIQLEDAILFPIKISLLETNTNETLKNETVFKLMESYPLEKELLFKGQYKFNFNLFYGDLKIYSDDDIKNLGELLLEMVTVYGSSKADTNAISSSEIKVYFLYDLNGIMSVTKIVRIANKLSKTLDYSEKMLHIPPLNGKQFHESFEKINNLYDEDLRRKHQENSLDALLTAIIDTRENLQRQDFISFAKSNELMDIKKKCDELTDWIQKSSEGWPGDYHVLDEKFVQLQDVVKPVVDRRTKNLTRKTVQDSEHGITKGIYSVEIINVLHTDNNIHPDAESQTVFEETTRNESSDFNLVGLVGISLAAFIIILMLFTIAMFRRDLKKRKTTL